MNLALAWTALAAGLNSLNHSVKSNSNHDQKMIWHRKKALYACNCNVAREKEIMGKRNVQIPNDYYILYLRRRNLLMSKRSLSVTSVNLITNRENRSELRSLCTSSTYDVVPFNLPGLLKSSQAVSGMRIHYRACPTTGGGSYCTLVCASLQWVSIQMRLGRHATLSHCRTSLHTLSPEEVRLVSLE